MVTIDLGAEGEFGRRLVRYLEAHLDSLFRLRYFTQPEQLFSENLSADLMILSRGFYQGISDQGHLPDLSDHNVIWITEEEQEDGYCLFHPPQELLEKIRFRLNQDSGEGDSHDGPSGIDAFFSPVFEPEILKVAQPYMKGGALYLDMGDMEGCSAIPFIKEHGEEAVNDDKVPDAHRGSMEDLCYYIHLREEDIIARVKELSVWVEGNDILLAPVLFLPLLELTSDDYTWFFEKLKRESVYNHIFISLGCAMFGSGKILPHIDRLLLVSSREDSIRRHCCEIMMKSAYFGAGQFHGSCELIFREDVLFDAG